MSNDLSDEAKSHFQRGVHFHRFGELDAAEEALKAAIAEEDSYAEAWNLLGLVYQEAEDFGKAVECFEKASKIDKKWTVPIENTGTLYYSQNNFIDAVETLKRYLDLGGDEIDTLLALAKAAFELNDCKTVLTATSAIIEINDDLYEVWEMRGICQGRLDRFNAACTSLNVAIDLNPRAISSLNTVGDLCYNAQNYTRAVEFYEPSYTLKRKQPNILFKYGTSLWFLDRWAEAIPLLEMYTELVPDDPRGWNNLGVVLREKGDVTRAVECYKHALQLDPKLKLVEKNIETAKEMQVLV
ncbi:MAG: tetratricopeptide repeat protein [Candidatus Thorarchaeota archaeon]